MVQFGFMTEEKNSLSFKLADNTILQTEKLEAGNSIYKISDTFEKVSLEDGSYRLVENFEIEVKDGKIEVVKAIFVDAKLVDGTVVKVEGDALVEGAKVVVVQGDAEVPAPDGVHELEDGTKIETKDGAIVAVAEKAPEVAAPEAEAPEVEVEVPMPMEKQIMELVQDFVKKVGQKMSEMEQNYNKLQNEFNAFKKEPAAKKITDGKTDFSSVNDTELDSRINAIMSLRKLNKN